MKHSRIFLLHAMLLAPLQAGSFTEATVTRVHQDVKTLKTGTAERSTTAGEKINAGTTVTTGKESRAELQFPDKSLARLGANARFTLKGEERTLDLGEGVLMLQVPKQMGGAKLRAAAVTAAISGTTVLFEYSPGKAVKLIVVEGEAHLFPNNDPGKFRTVKAGEMIVTKPDAKVMPVPVNVDLKRLLRTSKLLQENDANTPNEQQVASAVARQERQKEAGKLRDTPFVIHGRGTMVTVENLQSLKLDAVRDASTLPQVATASAPQPAGQALVKPAKGAPSIISTIPIVRPPPFVWTLDQASTIRPGGAVPPNLPNLTISGTDGPITIARATPWTGNVPLSNAVFRKPVFGDVSGNLGFGNGVPVLKFDALTITNGATIPASSSELVLASNGDIIIQPLNAGARVPRVAAPAQLQMNNDKMMLFARGGSIDIRRGSLVSGPSTALYGLAPSGRVLLDGTVLADTVHFAAGREILAQGTGASGTIQGFARVHLEAPIIRLNASRLNGGALNVAGGQEVAATDVVAVGTGMNLSAPRISLTNTRIGNTISTGGTGVGPVVLSGTDISATGSTLNGSTVTVESTRSIQLSNTKVDASGSNTATPERITLKSKNSINITDSSQLRALTQGNMALEAGGALTITDSLLSGGDVNLTAGAMALNNAQLSATNLRARVVAPDGVLLVNNSTLTATNLLQLYAEGNAGALRFTGNSRLSGANIRLAGKTVEIVNGARVDAAGNLQIFTDNAKFNTQGNGELWLGGTKGGTARPFSER